MATAPHTLPLALMDEQRQARWLFTIHGTRRLKVIKNPGHAASDDMYATSYPVQGMDGGWDGDMNPFLFVLAENGMIYHIHHLPPHWQHRAVTRLPLTRTCINFQAGLLGRNHVLLLEHAAPGEWGGTASHYQVQGRDMFPMDTAMLPRGARRLYVQTGPHIGCLSIDPKGALAASLLKTDQKRWPVPSPLPYTLPDPSITPSLIGFTDRFHLVWADPKEPTGYYATVVPGEEEASTPQAFPMDGNCAESEWGWLYDAENPKPLWQTQAGLKGRDPRRPQARIALSGHAAQTADMLPVRLVRIDKQHHRIAHRAFAALSGFSIVTEGSTKEGKAMTNPEEEDRLLQIEQRQKRLAAQMKEMYIALTQMQDEMVRHNRVLFQLEAATGTRTRTVKDFSTGEDYVEKETPRAKIQPKGLQVKDIQKD